ncbi:MAG: hypothetical protein ACYDAP_01070 [Thermoplasmataceae archaeon]
MLTDEEIGILTRLFDKAGITFGEAESEANSQEFNLIDFMYKLYFHSSVEALFTVNRKNITKDDREQINRLISKNTSYVLDATETTRNNIIDLLSHEGRELRKNSYREGEEIGRKTGYEEGRKETVKEFEEYFENINSSIPGFLSNYKKGLFQSHLHIPCFYCHKPMHFDETEGSWSEKLSTIEYVFEQYRENQKYYDWTDGAKYREDKEIEMFDLPSPSFELYNLSFIIGREHEHLKLVDKKDGSIIHLDQNDKNWPFLKKELEYYFSDWHHNSCYEEHERESEQDQDRY